MYAFDFDSFLKRCHTPEEIGAFIAEVRTLQSSEGSRTASAFFANQVGLRGVPAYNEAYYSQMMDYNLGLLSAYAGQEEQAAALIGKSGALPSDGAQGLFSDHQKRALELCIAQEKATVLGKPAIFLTSLPKSGSASLSQSIAEWMDVPVFRVSAGNYVLVPEWVQRIHRGAMVTHEHFLPTPHNLQTLKEAGISRLCVQLRDPRAATFSFFSMRVKQGMPGYNAGAFEEHLWEIYPAYVHWIASWIKAAQTEHWLHIHWIHYRHYQQSPWQVIAEMLSFIQTSPEWVALTEQKQQTGDNISSSNFHQGNDNAWREHVSAESAGRMWDSLSASIIDFLQLTQ